MDHLQEVSRADDILKMEKAANREQEAVVEEAIQIDKMEDGAEKREAHTRMAICVRYRFTHSQLNVCGPQALDRLHADEHRAADRRKEEARRLVVPAYTVAPQP